LHVKIQVLSLECGKISRADGRRNFARRPNQLLIAVQPRQQKYIPSGLAQIKSITRAVPFSPRGALRGRHERWERDAMDADVPRTNGA
jgi:hypothetical protein